MASISISNNTKTEIDDLKPDDMTYKEFADELVAAYRRDNGEVVDVDAMVDVILKRVAANIEVAAYRGVTEALE
jgi:hypothetical protein